MSQDRRATWDERYSAPQRVWSAEPNAEIVRIVSDWPPGRALDLGAGEGRHAIWLAAQGWEVTAIDFSERGIARGRDEAAARALKVTWIVDDVMTWEPDDSLGYDLVLAAYLHLDQDVFSRIPRWLAPGGRLVVVGHARRNLTEGVGGPQDPALLHDPAELRNSVAGLEIDRLEEFLRQTDQGDAIDLALIAHRADS